MNRFAVLSVLLLLAGVSFSLTAVSTCQVLDNVTDTSYYLTGHLSGVNPSAPNSCIKINSSNVIFDCNGFNITNNGTGGTTYGVLVGSASNVTVMNCPRITQYSNGVHLNRTNNSLVTGVTVYNNSAWGFYVDTSHRNTFTGNNATRNPGNGHYIVGCINNTFSNNFVNQSGSTNGFSIGSSNYNNFTNNSVYQAVGGFSVATGSSYNRFANNTVRSGYNGFVLNSATYNNLTGNNLSSQSNYAFSMTSSANYNLLANNTIASVYRGFSIDSSSYNQYVNNTVQGFSNAAFDFSNFANYNNLTRNLASGSFSWPAYHFDQSSNNRLVNNTAYNVGPGIALSRYSNDIVMTGNFIYNSSDAYFLYNSYNYRAVIDGNRAENISRYCFLLRNGINNNITNNNATNCGYGVYIDEYSSGNLVQNVSLNSTVWDLFVSPFNENYCLDTIVNLTGSGGRPVNYTNVSVNWADFEAAEVVLCNADGSTIRNVSVRGSDGAYNNGFLFSFVNNTAVNDSNSSGNYYGFYVSAGDGMTFNRNIAANNSEGGFVFASGGFNGVYPTNRTAMNDNLIYGTRDIGILVSGDTNISGGRLFNNTPDMRVYSFTADTLNITNVVFDNPAGTLQNFTNLSLYDVFDFNGYSINWSGAPSTTPLYPAVAGKRLDISVYSGSPIISSLTFRWAASDAAGLNESLFQLWKLSAGTWSSVNTTPDTGARTLSLYNHNPASVYAILNGNCPVITASGTYSMGNNFIGTPNDASPIVGTACVKIAASNVIFDCSGYSITNNGTAGITHGIVLNSSLNNVTVRNCPRISDYTRGVYVYNSTNVWVSNVTAYNFEQHAFITGLSSGVVMSNNTAYNASFYGFYLTNSDGNAYINNTARNNTQNGFYVQNSDNNNFTGNRVSNNSIGFAVTGSTYNRFSNNTVNNHSDLGISLTSTSANNNFTGNNVTWSYYYGFFVDSDYNVLRDNIASYNSLNGGGYSSISLNLGSLNTVVNNTVSNNFADGIFVYTSGNALANNTVHSNRNGIFVGFGDSNVLTGNTAYDNTASGFALSSSADNNTLVGNTAYRNSLGFSLASSSNNRLENNTAYNQTSDGITMSSSGSSNLTGNVLYLNTNNGISMYPSSSNNRIIGNNAYNNGQMGYYVYSGSNDNLFANNTATANNQAGFYMNVVAGNVLAGNNIRGWGNYGILLFGSNNTMIANNAINSAWNGVWISSCQNTSLDNNTVNGSTQYGLNIQGSNLTTISKDHYYNNSADFRVNGTGITVNLSGVVFDNPAGGYENFTNLSLSDIVASSYSISWAGNSSLLPLPAGSISFGQKFVNITPLSGAVSIDSIVWNWLDSESASPYLETQFQLWKHNGSWINTAAALNASANTLSLNPLGNFSIFAILQAAPESGEDNPEEASPEGYNVDITPACNGFIVSVKDGGSPVPDAFITGTDETHATELGARYTNSSGQAYFPDCDIDVSVKAAKSARQGTDSGTAACGFCPECATDDDCADSEQCSSQQCVPVDCPNGRVINHACELFECVEDSDCPVGQSCIDHRCKTVYECTYGLANTTADDNADCADNEYCDVPVGQAWWKLQADNRLRRHQGTTP